MRLMHHKLSISTKKKYHIWERCSCGSFMLHTIVYTQLFPESGRSAIIWLTQNKWGNSMKTSKWNTRIAYEVIKKNRDCVYGIWQYEVLRIKNYFGVKSFARKIISQTWVMYKDMNKCKNDDMITANHAKRAYILRLYCLPLPPRTDTHVFITWHTQTTVSTAFLYIHTSPWSPYANKD